MKTAVTGASGHAGNNLCRLLLAQGHKVRVLRHKDTKSLQNLDVDKIDGDVLNPSALEDFTRGTDVVFHLAARISLKGSRKEMLRINVEGTRNILNACKKNKVGKLVYFSTIHALQHGHPKQRLDENRPLIESSNIKYERSKAMGEKIIREHSGASLETVILNPTAIIGPHDYKPSLSGTLLLQLKNRTIPALIPGGYNWVDVRDVAHAASCAIEKGRHGHRYILSGHWHSVKEISEMVEKHAGKRTAIRVLPFFMAWMGLPFIQMYARIKNEQPLYNSDTLKIVARSSKSIINRKAREELDFDPRPIEETVSDTLQWFEDHLL